MERLERRGRLVDHGQWRSPGGSGFAVADCATGGASDANTTAGMGVPTLDGLGPIGGNDHAPAEYLELDSIVPRTTLLRGARSSAGRRAIRVVAAGGRWRRRVPEPRTRRRPDAGDDSERPPADLVRRAVGGARATAGRSSSAIRAGSRARPTRVRTAGRCIRATPAPRRARASRSSRRRSPRPGSALADVVRTRMFVTDIADAAGGARGARRRSSATIRPAATIVEVSALLDPTLARRDRGRRPPCELRCRSDRECVESGMPAGDDATISTRRRRTPSSRFARRATMTRQTNDRDPFDADVERRVTVGVGDDHHADRGERRKHGRPDQPEIVERELRQPVEARRQQRPAPATGRSRRTSALPAGRGSCSRRRRDPASPRAGVDRRQSSMPATAARSGRASPQAARRRPPATIRSPGSTARATTTADAAPTIAATSSRRAGDQPDRETRPSPPERRCRCRTWPGPGSAAPSRTPARVATFQGMKVETKAASQ